METKRAAAYIRVANGLEHDPGDGVDSPLQERRLVGMIEKNHWALYRVYSDPVSEDRERRPGLDALMADARNSAIDAVVVWRLTALAGTTRQLARILSEFRSLGIVFISYLEKLDTSTPMGKAILDIIAGSAELDRGLIRQRVITGMEQARAHGTKSGRPVGRPRVQIDGERAAQLRTEGLSWRAIARELKVSVAAVRRACRRNWSVGGS